MSNHDDSRPEPQLAPPDTGNEQTVISHGWERFLGFFVDNKLVVVLGMLLVVGAGLWAAPFDWHLGSFPRSPVAVDAIPDIGANQQIVFTKWPGRSPRDIEDQITYPLTTALLGIPGVRTVRSSSMFGFSSIYVIFKDGVDFYWSRSRVLEKLASLPPGLLPPGVSPTLGPDATALGQVFWYTLEGHDGHGHVTGGWSLAERRSVQDWTIRYALQSVAGVSEVASVGGYVREYQVDVDPDAMLAHGVTLAQVAAAVKNANVETGARTIEINRVEYVVRGLGYVRHVRDLEQAVVAVKDQVPIRIADIAHVHLGPAERRGALDDGGAPAVGGVVIARYGVNPLAVIHRVKEKLAEIGPGLPQKVLPDGTVSKLTIVPFYDRTQLIHRTLNTLSGALFEEILVTVLVVLVMLRELRSSLVISSLLPLGVLAAFVLMKAANVDANVMALAGIAIAIGEMVDIGIIFTENIEQHIERGEDDPSRWGLFIRRAIAEVAPAVMTSVLTIVVSFLPVFALTASAGKLFKPLAYTKTFAVGASLLIAMVALPSFAHLLLRRRPGAPPGDATGRRHILRSLFRLGHVRDYLLVVGGAAIWPINAWAGAFVLFLGLSRLVHPLVPGRVQRGLSAAEIVLAVAGVAAMFAAHWLPLGHNRSLALNALFVGLLLGGVLGVFALFHHYYRRLLAVFLRRKTLFLATPVVIVVLGLTSWLGFPNLFGWLPRAVRTSRPAVALARRFPGLGREFMPPFDEGQFLYMPTTMAHASIGESLSLLHRMDAAIAQIPEVSRVVGKLGRADTPLDPAPISMFEVMITYKPEYRRERDGTLVRQWRPEIHSPHDIWNEIANAAALPGLTSAPVLQPIQTRLIMLQIGMRAPMGIKVHGPDLNTLEAFGLKLEAILKTVPALRPETVIADRVVGKPYVEIVPDREALGRYGLSVGALAKVIDVALGGETLTRAVIGRERYPIRVRYMREDRDSIDALERVLVPTPMGAQIPLAELAHIRYVRGPQVIKSENTFLTSYVLFDKHTGVSEVDAVEQAQATIQARIASGSLRVPPGVSWEFAGSYKNAIRSDKKMMVLLPLALAIVFLIIYLQFRRISTSLIIYSGVAVAIAGGFLLVWAYGQPWFMNFSLFGTSMRGLFHVGTVNMSVAVWIGFIALLGVSTNDGVIMATYLSQRFRAEPPRTIEEVRARTLEAGLRRVRPCLMTTAVTIIALLPVIVARGSGSDVMMPMALPSVGGMSIQLVTLFVVPVLYSTVEEARLRRRQRADANRAISDSDRS